MLREPSGDSRRPGAGLLGSGLLSGGGRSRRAEIALPALATSPAQARRFARLVAESWDLEAVCDVLSLLLSELVTNAVVHGDSEVRVVITAGPTDLRAEVHDSSGARLRRRRQESGTTGGRGLFLVEAMSRASGVELHTGGKAVWFEVPLTGDHVGSVMSGLGEEAHPHRERHIDLRSTHQANAAAEQTRREEGRRIES